MTIQENLHPSPEPEEGITEDERRSLLPKPSKPTPLQAKMDALEFCSRLGVNGHLEANPDGTRTLEIRVRPEVHRPMRVFGAVRVVSPEVEIFNNLVRRRRP